MGLVLYFYICFYEYLQTIIKQGEKLRSGIWCAAVHGLELRGVSGRYGLRLCFAHDIAVLKDSWVCHLWDIENPSSPRGSITRIPHQILKGSIFVSTVFNLVTMSIMYNEPWTRGYLIVKAELSRGSLHASCVLQKCVHHL